MAHYLRMDYFWKRIRGSSEDIYWDAKDTFDSAYKSIPLESAPSNEYFDALDVFVAGDPAAAKPSTYTLKSSLSTTPKGKESKVRFSQQGEVFYFEPGEALVAKESFETGICYLKGSDEYVAKELELIFPLKRKRSSISIHSMNVERRQELVSSVHQLFKDIGSASECTGNDVDVSIDWGKLEKSSKANFPEYYSCLESMVGSGRKTSKKCDESNQKVNINSKTDPTKNTAQELSSKNNSGVNKEGTSKEKQGPQIPKCQSAIPSDKKRKKKKKKRKADHAASLQRLHEIAQDLAVKHRFSSKDPDIEITKQLAGDIIDDLYAGLLQKNVDTVTGDYNHDDNPWLRSKRLKMSEINASANKPVSHKGEEDVNMEYSGVKTRKRSTMLSKSSNQTSYHVKTDDPARKRRCKQPAV